MAFGSFVHKPHLFLAMPWGRRYSLFRCQPNTRFTVPSLVTKPQYTGAKQSHPIRFFIMLRAAPRKRPRNTTADQMVTITGLLVNIILSDGQG